MLLAGRDVVSDGTAPEFVLFKGFEGEAGDDAEVVGAAF